MVYNLSRVIVLYILLEGRFHFCNPNTVIQAYKADNHNFCLPHVHSMPSLGGGILVPVRCGKTRMVWLLDGENFLEDTFIRLDQIHERHR